MNPRLVAAARRLGLDRAAGEAFGALRQAGIPSVVLKGPALAEALYPGGDLRFYTDIDVLVAPERREAATHVLRDLGYEQSPFRERDGLADHARVWLRANDRSELDLHWTLPMVAASPEEVWTALSDRTQTMTLLGTEVAILAPAAMACHVALHAAQHGEAAGKSMDDLTRALAHFDEPTWEEAAALASRLGGASGFAAGLGLAPAGRELAERLGLRPNESLVVELRSRSAPETALGWYRFMERRGVAARLRYVAEELAPSPAFMRVWAPWSARGRVALAAAYAWRPLWLVGRSIPAMRSIARARREVRRTSSQRAG